MIYCDYAATSPVDPEVVKVMNQYLGVDGLFANASNVVHQMGRDAYAAVERAREQVAGLINAFAEEVVFTGNATESINMAIKGTVDFYHRKGRHIITLSTEHKAVSKVCDALEKQGCEVTRLGVQASGLVDLQLLKDAIRDDTVMVSILHVNNEFGVIQDIQAIAEIVKEKNSFLHVDAVQSAGKLEIDVVKTPIDFLSFSGHKLYAPKGVGALYVRKGVRIKPVMQGASQERGLRPGTLAVHQIAAMGKAFEIAASRREQDMAHYQHLNQVFFEEAKDITTMMVNGDRAHCIPNIINVSFAEVDPLHFIEGLSKHVAISTGAACSTGNMEPSAVLCALGLSVPRAQSAIRFSFGRYTTEADVRNVVGVLKEILCLS